MRKPRFTVESRERSEEIEFDRRCRDRSDNPCHCVRGMFAHLRILKTPPNTKKERNVIVLVDRAMRRFSLTHAMGASPILPTEAHRAVWIRYRYLTTYLDAEKEAGRAHPRLTQEWDTLRGWVLGIAAPFVGTGGVVDSGLDPRDKRERQLVRKAIAWSRKNDPMKRMREKFLRSKKTKSRDKG